MAKLKIKSGVFAGREVQEIDAIEGEVRAEGDALAQNVSDKFQQGVRDASCLAVVLSNKEADYRLSYICPYCKYEHRATMSFEDAIRTAQAMLLTGHSAVAIVASDEIHNVTPDDVKPGDEVVHKLDELLRNPPKGNA